MHLLPGGFPRNSSPAHEGAAKSGEGFPQKTSLELVGLQSTSAPLLRGPDEDLEAYPGRASDSGPLPQALPSSFCL